MELTQTSCMKFWSVFQVHFIIYVRLYFRLSLCELVQVLFKFHKLYDVVLNCS